MDLEINTREYWDHRFKNDWDASSGRAQTCYFTDLCASMLPEWLIRDIRAKNHTLCDLGCAEGDALPRLAKLFPGQTIEGLDFSSEAIQTAAKRFPDYPFQTFDLMKDEPKKQYGVVYCSNVLEHFVDFDHVIRRVLALTQAYVIFLVPYREDFEVHEHVTIFKTDIIPVLLDHSMLVYVQSVKCYSDLYGGEQILLVYSKDPVIQGLARLSHYVEGVSNAELKKVTLDWKNENDAHYQASQEAREYRQKFTDLQSDQLRANQLQANQQLIQFQANQQLIQLQANQLQANQLQASQLHTNQQLIHLQANQIQSNQQTYESLVAEVENKLMDSQSTCRLLQERNNSLKMEYDKLAALKDQGCLGGGQVLLEDAKNSVRAVRGAKTYKIMLFMRRMKDQLVHGGKEERKDFWRYVRAKMRFGQPACKPLMSFDRLGEVEQNLASILAAESTSHHRRSADLGSADNGKRTGQVFIFAGIPYYDIGGGQRCSQLAKTFNRMGYEVYYYYAFDSSESVKFSLDLPVVIHQSIEMTAIEKVVSLVREHAVFIFEAPFYKFIPYLDAGHRMGIPTIYEHIDNWETSLGSLLYDRESYLHFVLQSQKLVATSEGLIDQIQSGSQREALYLPNAVDSDMFEPTYSRTRPQDLVVGRDKTLLYFGSLWGEWFDWDLVRKTAQACESSAFNFIGDDGAIDEVKKTLPANIHFLGLKKQTELAAYLQYSDMAILPFKNCDIGRYVSPLKIFEYIAMDKYVLATPLPDIKGYPNTLCSDQAEDWIRAIGTSPPLQDVRSFVDANSWYARCTALIDSTGLDFDRERPDKETLSVIVLNYNNNATIFRCIDSLIRHGGRYRCEIVVVDNGSSDGSYERLRETYGDQILLLSNQVNGCASGRNLGVKASHGDWLFFLDSDQWVVNERWLDTGLYVLAHYRGIGALSWGAGWFADETVTGPIVDYFPNRGISPGSLFRDDVSYLATSGFLIRRAVFEQTNGFDHKYDPTCFEDTDLSMQVRHLGLMAVYCPYLGLMHLPHQTTKSGSHEHQRLIERNAAYFLEKWRSLDEPLLREMMRNGENP